MPRESFIVSPLPDNSLNSLNRFVAELNGVMARLTVVLARIEGFDGMTPEVRSNLDLGGHRIVNGGTPEQDTDVQLAGLSLGAADFTSPFDARGRGIVNAPRAKNSSDVVVLQQLVDVEASLQTIINTNVVTLDGTQTISGEKTFTATVNFDGTLDHDGTLIGEFGATPAGQVAALADAVTAHNITDPTDSPVDADALRDDIVAVVLPSIEGMLNALGVKINSLIDFAQAHGRMAT